MLSCNSEIVPSASGEFHISVFMYTCTCHREALCFWDIALQGAEHIRFCRACELIQLIEGERFQSRA